MKPTEAAHVSGCTPNTIYRLLAAGHITGTRGAPHRPGGHPTWDITASKREVQEAVSKYAPGSGRKHRSPNARSTPAAVRQEVLPKSALEVVTWWRAMPEEKRRQLFNLGGRTVAEIKLAIELIDG